jgi:hypothetical protein
MHTPPTRSTPPAPAGSLRPRWLLLVPVLWLTGALLAPDQPPTLDLPTPTTVAAQP